MRALATDWFVGARDEREKKVREELIRASSTMAMVVLEILDRWEDELNRQEINKDDYDSPNWSHKQAHRNGERSRIKKVRDLFAFVKGDK